MIQNTYIYARQSLGDKFSIETQIKRCEQRAQKEDWRVLDTFRDGKGASEYTSGSAEWKERPGFVALLDAIDKGEADYLIIWEASRASRTSEGWLELIRRGKRWGLKIHVFNKRQTYDTTDPAHCRALETAAIAAAAGADERSEWAKRGHEDARELGRPPAGPVPLGYKRIRNEDGALERWELDPEWAPTVVKMFKAVAAQQKTTALGRKYSTDELKLYPSRIQRMIRKPQYITKRPYTEECKCECEVKGCKREGRKYCDEHKCGNNHYHLVDGDASIWPPLVSEELWQKANAALDSHTKKQPRAPKRFLLSGVIQCEECLEDPPEDHPTHMRGSSSGPSRRGNRVGRYSCYKGNNYVDAVEAEEAVEKALFEVLANPEVHHRVKESSEQGNAQLQKLDKEIAQEESELKELLGLRKDRKISLSQFAELQEDSRSTIQKLKAKRAKLAAPESVESLVDEWAEPGPGLRFGVLPEEIKVAHDAYNRAVDRYQKMTIGKRRQLIRDVLTVTARRAKRKGAYEPIADRLTIRPRV